MDGLPGNFPVAADPVRVCGAMVEVDENTDRALRISRVNETVSESEYGDTPPSLLREFAHRVAARAIQRRGRLWWAA
jgi:hypothetical protein